MSETINMDEYVKLTPTQQLRYLDEHKLRILYGQFVPALPRAAAS